MVSCSLEDPLSLLSLPSELLLRIFLLLGTPKAISQILQVCRAWNITFKDDRVWKQMLREGQYKLPSKMLPTGFTSWKDLHRVLELYREFVCLSLTDYIEKCCPYVLMQNPQLTQEFAPKIRKFLSDHLHLVKPCDVLLHGHEIADKSGFHHHWCYAAYKKESGLYDYTRYYLWIDRKNHNYVKSHVDMMMKGDVVIHNQHEWICWHLSMHFFDTMSVNTLFDMLLAMFFGNIAASEWEYVDPSEKGPPNTTCEEMPPTEQQQQEQSPSQRQQQQTTTPKSSKKERTRGSEATKITKAMRKWAPSYNCKNSFR